MQVNIKTYKPFMSAVNDLKEKYGEHFEYYNGFHDSQLSLTEFIDNFIDVDTVADATIDPNANSATKDIRTLLNDMMKPYQKLLCFNKIFYELTKKYNINVAREWLEAEWNGTFYLHNAHTSTYLPYCFAYDLDSIVEKGLFFLDSFGAKPAKHLTTFNNHVLEFVSWVSNRSSGAVGLPSYLIYSFWFWKNDVDNGFYLKSPEYYRDQSFQEVIYNLNQPYLRVTESTFSNFTIMDREYITEIFGGRTYPDGTYVIDYLDELINYQKAFMKVVSKIRYERMMTFPVITFSLLAQNPKLEKMKRKNKQAVEIADNILNIIYEDYAKNNESLNSFKNHIKSNSKLLTILENKIHDKLKQENIDIDENELIEAELDKVRFIDEDFAKWCVKHNMEWNDSNFYIGNDVTSLSSCCRLISNFDELNKSKKAKGFINSIGGTSLRIGSVQVNTINLVRIAKLVKCLNCDSLDEEIEMY